MKIGIEYLEPLPFGTNTGVFTEGRYLLQLARMFSFYKHSVDILCSNANEVIPEGNIRFLEVDQADTQYDVYLVQGWTAPKDLGIESRLYLCCMFFPEHIIYKRTYWIDYCKRPNWFCVYPYSDKSFDEYFLNGPILDKTMCLPFPHYQQANLSVDNNFYSKKVAFNYKDLIKKRHQYSVEKEKVIHEIEQYIDSLGFEIIDFPTDQPYSNVLDAVKDLKFFFSLFMGGSFTEVLDAGGVPILVWPPQWSRPILHKQKAIDLGTYLEYPLDIEKFKNIFVRLSEDESYFQKVLSGYKGLFVNNDFQKSKKFFDKIYERVSY